MIVLVVAAKEGLPGLIQVLQLPVSGAFYVLHGPRSQQSVRQWLSDAGANATELSVNRGIGAGWTLLECDGLGTHGAPSALGPLRVPDRVKIRLRYGIRSAPGNNFLSVAPPAVVVDGAPPGYELRSDGVPVSSDDLGLHWLEQDESRNGRIRLAVVSDGRDLRHLTLSLAGEEIWAENSEALRVDRWGNKALGDDWLLQGAYCRADVGELPLDVSLVPGVAESDRAWVLGPSVGQVADASSWHLLDWPVVWVVVKQKRKLHAHFCGTRHDELRPVAGVGAGADMRAVATWKELLWGKRKRIDGPRGDLLTKSLWVEYQVVARDC